MISVQHKFIFLHIPKTAGTSIGKLFDMKYGQYLPIRKRKHGKASMLSEEYPKKWKEYFKFTFIRNPWDRELSFYMYRLNRIKIHKRLDPNTTFEQYVTKAFHSGRKRNQQIDWLISNGTMEVDFIGRFERLESDFHKICNILNINKKLPHMNATKHDHYSTYYNDTTRQMVETMYSKDINLFGYKFGGI